MDESELQRIASGFQTSAVLLAAAELGIASELARRAWEPEVLALELGLDARATRAVCEALAAAGIVGRDARAFRVVEPLRGALTADGSSSLVEIFRHQWNLMARWARLDEVVRSGEPVPRPAGDGPQRRAFILAMADLARRSAGLFWDAVDLRGRAHLVDVGGGPGELAISALERFPSLRATVFDHPEVLDIARGYARPRSVGDRLSFVAGDALAAPIPSCDVALVSSLVHAYGEEETRRIAANVAAGTAVGGTLVIREFMWDDGDHTGPLSTALFAVNMLVGTRAGRCYTAEELAALFGGAGFGGWRVVRIDARSTLLVGERC